MPYILTCSDDMLIKLWDWDKVGAAPARLAGHTSARTLVQGCDEQHWWHTLDCVDVDEPGQQRRAR
jgi:hypothetical protein